MVFQEKQLVYSKNIVYLWCDFSESFNALRLFVKIKIKKRYY